jgi:hypothetical protein
MSVFEVRDDLETGRCFVHPVSGKRRSAFFISLTGSGHRSPSSSIKIVARPGEIGIGACLKVPSLANDTLD